MALWEQFPFTDFHGENIDWLVNNVNNLNAEVKDLQEGGGQTKAYVDAEVDKEAKSRITADQILQNQISSHTTTIGQLGVRVTNTEKMIGTKPEVPNFDTLWGVIGSYNATQTIGSKTLQNQTEITNNSRMLVGTGGTYDFSKGTVQARLNTIEGSLQSGSLVKQVGSYLFEVNAGATSGTQVGRDVDPFDFAVCFMETAATAPSKAPGNGDYVILNVGPIKTSTDAKFTRIICEARGKGATTANNLRIRVNTFANITGTTGDQYATVSYVDDQLAQVTDDVAAVQADISDLSTATTNAVSAANNAKTTADSAASAAKIANDKIGSKPSTVKHANIWETIGSWGEAFSITNRLLPAYNWSWNSRSAINGSADYPTDKATINERLKELEDQTAKQKIISGSDTLTVATGQETVIDYTDAGFTGIPQVVVSFSTDGANPAPTGIIKIFEKTTTGCKITISSGASGVRYPIDWIATGK